jgi:flagellar assembly protein FliH
VAGAFDDAMREAEAAMKDKSALSLNTTRPQVLRNVQIQAQAHTLARPATSAAASSSNAVGLDRTAISTPQHEVAMANDAASKEAYKRGYEEGWAEAHAARREAEFETKRREGFEQGRLEGLIAGQEAADAAAKESVRRIEQLANSLHSQVATGLAAVEDDAVALCFEIILRMLGEKAAALDGIRALVTEAAKQIGARTLTAIHLHPDDLELLQSVDAETELFRREGQYKEVRFVADTAIKLGGAVLRTSLGSVDARLETQIETLRRTLLMVRASRRTEQADAISASEEATR